MLLLRARFLLPRNENVNVEFVKESAVNGTFSNAFDISEATGTRCSAIVETSRVVSLNIDVGDFLFIYIHTRKDVGIIIDVFPRSCL